MRLNPPPLRRSLSMPPNFARSHAAFFSTNALFQLNVQTQEKESLEFSSDYFLNEPWFVARKDPESEDDGVLVIGGYRASTGKGVHRHAVQTQTSLVLHVSCEVMRCIPVPSQSRDRNTL